MKIETRAGVGVLAYVGAVAATVAGVGFAGVHTNAPAAHAETVADSSPAWVDDPGWTCMRDDSRVLDAAVIIDAWEAFKASVPDATQEDFRSAYVTSYSTQPSWPGYEIMASKHYRDVYHVFLVAPRVQGA